MAYAAQNGDEYFVVAGDVTFGPYELVGTLVTAELGHSFAFTFRANGRRVINLDGVVLDKYLTQISPVFSPNGKRLAYMAFDGEVWLIDVDGRALPGFEEVSLPVFSADSKHIAYVGIVQGHSSLVIDGAVRPIEAVAPWAVWDRFEKDFRLVFREDGQWFLSHSALRLGDWKNIADPRIGTDSQSLVFLARGRDDPSEGWRIVSGGVASERWLDFSEVCVSESGDRVVFIAKALDESWRVGSKTWKSEPFQQASGLELLDDGRCIGATVVVGRSVFRMTWKKHQ